jgi:hypothetical protein
MLSRLGAVELVDNPHGEVDRIFDVSSAAGEECRFLCLAEPHRVPVGLRCPTYPVFAWAYSTIPDETWGGNQHDNWRLKLKTFGSAITFSDFAARSVRAAVGSRFPVCAISPPFWDRLSRLRSRLPSDQRSAGRELCVQGIVVDSRTSGLSADLLVAPVRPYHEQVTSSPAARPALQYKESWGEKYRTFISGFSKKTPPAISASIPASAPSPTATLVPKTRLQLDGVIYAADFNPTDGTKNWFDMISAFCWAFRDTADATLVMKMNHNNYGAYRDFLTITLARLEPFKCRVIAIQAPFGDAEYEQLIAAASYVVDTSECEGLSVSLMEFMACGRPAIAPRHTAMEDYIESSRAFVIRSSKQLGTRPHDWKRKYRMERFRLNWQSLFDAYRESYRIAKSEPQRYAAMSHDAQGAMRDIASDEVVASRLLAFFASEAKTSEGSTDGVEVVAAK